MSNFIVFARRTDIRKISLDVNYVADVVIPLGEIRNAIAIGIDRVAGKSCLFYFLMDLCPSCKYLTSVDLPSKIKKIMAAFLVLIS